MIVRRNQRNNWARFLGDRRDSGDNNQSSQFQVLVEISDDEGSHDIGHDNMHVLHENIKKDSETINKHVQPKLDMTQKLGKKGNKYKDPFSIVTMQKKCATNVGNKNKTVVTSPQTDSPHDVGVSLPNDPKGKKVMKDDYLDYQKNFRLSYEQWKAYKSGGDYP